MTTTYAEIERDALAEVDEWLADNPGADDEKVQRFIEESSSEWVPSMTTELFGLVVSDNALAFYEADSASDEPFQVLFSAVRARLALAMTERWQGEA